MQQNEEASAKYCQTKLDQISKTLKESISAGVSLFLEGTNSTRKQWKGYKCDYFHVPRKGVKVRNKGSMENLQNRVQGVS